MGSKAGEINEKRLSFQTAFFYDSIDYYLNQLLFHFQDLLDHLLQVVLGQSSLRHLGLIV